MRLLIVDDDKNHLDLYLSHIQSLKFPIKPFTAESAADALKIIQRKETQPHVILLDLMMSDSGFELLNQFPKDIRHEVYIIVVSKVDSARTQDMALKMGADYYYCKFSPRYSPAKVILHAINSYKHAYTAHIDDDTPVTYDVTELVKAEMTNIELVDGVGHDYVIEAIILNVEEVQQGRAKLSITDICNMLAKKYKKSDSSVESAMSDVIRRTWRFTDDAKLASHYQGAIDPNRGSPTTREFNAFYTRKVLDIIRKVK